MLRSLSFVLLFMLFWSSQSEAQTFGGNYNFRNFEQKPYYFGITLGYNSSDYRPFRSKSFLENQTIKGVESINEPGFNLAIVTNLKVGNYFDLRLLPGFSFAGRRLAYNQVTDDGLKNERSVESVFVEIPFHVRYKSKAYKDTRLFLIAGVKYSFDVASDSRTRQADSLVKIAPTDFAAEAGAGAQFFFPYFIFSPEIKVSYGLNNILIYDRNLEESTVLDKILSRTFTISFHFEG